jgi:hypothetical protein
VFFVVAATTAMSKYIHNAGAFYSYIARGHRRGQRSSPAARRAAGDP